MPNSDPDVFGSSQRDLRKMLTKTPVFPLCEGAPYARCGACPASVRWDCHLAGTEEGWESWLEKGCAQKEKTYEQLILGVWLAWRFLKVLKVFDVWIFCYIATLCLMVSDSILDTQKLREISSGSLVHVGSKPLLGGVLPLTSAYSWWWRYVERPPWMQIIFPIAFPRLLLLAYIQP